MKWYVTLLLGLSVNAVVPSVATAKTGAYIIHPDRTVPASDDEKNDVELVLCYSFSVKGQNTGTTFLVELPQTIADKQKILSIECTPKPTRKFERNGNSYAEFLFNNGANQFTVVVTIKAELYRYDLSTARRKHSKGTKRPDELKDFLKNEHYIDKDDPQIRNVAAGISAKTETEIVRKIYNYVIDNMEYVVQGEKDLGAAEALKKKKGDCCEYSDLFVALCRAKNIPARVVTGYTERFDKVSAKHHWVEVYLQPYGWVPFDASWGDVDIEWIRNNYFDHMRPVYLYLSNIRNDKTLYNNHFFAYIYYSKGITIEDTVRFIKQPNHHKSGRGD